MTLPDLLPLSMVFGLTAGNPRTRIFLRLARFVFDTQPFMHDRTGRRVLHMHLLVRLNALLDRERGERGFMEAAKNQFLLSRVEIDVAHGVDTRLRRLEFLGIDIDRFPIDIESPFGDGAQLRRETEEYQDMIG